uniref:NB-ARC domain-containing protein n=1 Tax=Lactuca sativa TaxID=4236 RepID=A0A9R1UHS3_LACSA|nr:hypothetical protein LSAT_V11C900492280 [Lactuca sativa]
MDESLKDGPLVKLHLIVESQEIFLVHPDNDLPKLLFTCFYKQNPSSLARNLEKLISCGLCAFTNRECFLISICGKPKLEGSIPEAPNDLDQLVCLEQLSFSFAKFTYLPQSICKLKHFKYLQINYCSLLRKLPEDIGRLECLKTLMVVECGFLQDNQSNICNMKRL